MSQAKIMVVEDEGLIANDIALQLRRGDYAIEGMASSGEEALHLLESLHPDLVLMDIRLRGKLDGIDTASRVRTDYHLPVIFLTSHADAETLSRAKRAGPAGYIVKPFRQINLCSAIEMAMFKHKSELALMEREAWLSTALQSTADPMIVLNSHGCVQFLNSRAEDLLQRTLFESLGCKLSEVMHLVDEQGSTIYDTALMHKVELGSGTLLRRPDQSELKVEGEVAPSIAGGAFAGVVITIRDVSKRKERESKRREEQKMLALGRLASGVAHDFNNLLTIIIGHASQLKGSTATEQGPRIDAVLDAASTAAGVTRQLLTISGNLVISSEEIDVNDRIHRLMTLMTGSLGSKITASTVLDPATGKVRMNSSQFDQIVMNLLTNARDAMPGGGKVAISTSNVDLPSAKEEGGLDQYVRVVIKDSGPGISAEIREHMFEPFFSTKVDGVNCGLGLSIIYGIVQDAGGRIELGSGKDAGASFEILLPRVAPPAPIAVPPQITAGHASKKTILLAEDDCIVRELLSRYLGELGFNMIIAEDGQEAIEAANRYVGRIDLLLSDVRMPRMDGLALVQLLSVSRPETKALLMSGYIGDSAKFPKKARSMVSFIEKPFLPPNLLERVNQLTSTS